MEDDLHPPTTPEPTKGCCSINIENLQKRDEVRRLQNRIKQLSSIISNYDDLDNKEDFRGVADKAVEENKENVKLIGFLEEKIQKMTVDMELTKRELDIEKGQRKTLEADLQKVETRQNQASLERDEQVQAAQTDHDGLTIIITQLKYKVASLQVDLDNSVVVQNGFVRLSQSLQVELEKIRKAEKIEVAKDVEYDGVLSEGKLDVEDDHVIEEVPAGVEEMSMDKVASLQVDLDNSVAVQNEFVRLSQSLQVELEKIRQAEKIKVAKEVEYDGVFGEGKLYVEEDHVVEKVPAGVEEMSMDKVASLQVDLDNSVAVQNDFVRLSQSLQVELEKNRQAEVAKDVEYDGVFGEGKLDVEEDHVMKEVTAGVKETEALDDLFSMVAEVNNNGVVYNTCFCQGSDDVPGIFSCQIECQAALSCGAHYCVRLCHGDLCGDCPYSIYEQITCQCGKFPVLDFPPRESCSAPLVVCGESCNKLLGCGSRDAPHTCLSQCHDGPCPPCELETDQKCRCRKVTTRILCTNNNFELICNNSCRKNLKCGNHRF